MITDSCDSGIFGMSYLYGSLPICKIRQYFAQNRYNHVVLLQFFNIFSVLETITLLNMVSKKVTI